MATTKLLQFGLLVAVALIGLVAASQPASFDVHRLLQYQSENLLYGSQKAAVTQYAASLDSAQSLSGQMLLLHLESTTLPQLKQVRTPAETCFAPIQLFFSHFPPFNGSPSMPLWAILDSSRPLKRPCLEDASQTSRPMLQQPY